jgi:hypothetical protein
MSDGCADEEGHVQGSWWKGFILFYSFIAADARKRAEDEGYIAPSLC